MKKKRWADLSTGGKVAIIVLGTIQLALLVVTLWDIRQRPAEEIRGDKRMWTALAFIDWFGPLAYFTVGRKEGIAGLLDRCGCCRTDEGI